MFTYDITRLRSVLKEVISNNVTSDAMKWLEATVSEQNSRDIRQFNIAFVAMPRKTGKEIIKLSDAEHATIQSVRSGLTIQGWTIDRLSRVWLLMHLDHSRESDYIRIVENLFLNAEMNEQVALYSALPVLAFPESWTMRCAEGIRSNIAFVLESIMCNNPYPSEQLEEKAWNQLVLKAIFTEKPLHHIIGLHERSNEDLANALADFARERWAAHRQVNPMIWICVGRFINDRIFPCIEHLSVSDNVAERQAAALVCAESSFAPAKELLNQNADLMTKIKNGSLTWQALAFALS